MGSREGVEDGKKVVLGFMDTVGVVEGLGDAEGEKVGGTAIVGKGEGLAEGFQLGKAEGYGLSVGEEVALS